MPGCWGTRALFRVKRPERFNLRCADFVGIESGILELSGDYEDIHTFVEGNLIQRIGETGKKLHTGRSRNDQVALDMRLYARNCADRLVERLRNLIEALEETGQKHNCIMPGYTHLQRAQAVTFRYYMALTRPCSAGISGGFKTAGNS